MYELSYSGGPLTGHIELTSSKSLSNRALIIQALTPGGFTIERLATADDTVRLQRLLQTKEEVLDAGPAGTTFRFLTAFLCRRSGSQVLTGSQRMKERPIGILVDALRTLGADITYVEKEGYPPLRIGQSDLSATNQLTISAGTSSQYISALLMLAPTLPKGLHLTLDGDIVSLPYINMTLSMMAQLGVQHRWEGQTIIIDPQVYTGANLPISSKSGQAALTIEADWSAASYYYSLAAIAPEADLQIDGLFRESVQGDSVLQEMYTKFGVQTTFNATGLRLTKATTSAPQLFEYDFLECPDVAQTLAVTCAALGTKGLFTGLKTLKIKETDRVAALKEELKKVGTYVSELPARFSPRAGRDYVMVDEKATIGAEPPVFATYHDHRMAMAFAPLALLGPIRIEDPMVVVKSYPEFYEDFAKLGITYKEV
ncbi:MAG: 3-phosphoshikimate 1-carboxyvinyltransferase [Bacteroidota bacterium]